MHSNFKWISSIILASLLLSLAIPVAAQSGDRFFPETGHSLDSHFTQFFDTYGGSDIFGFPITESFTDPNSQRLVQYTENARFELIQDGLTSEPRVQLAPLGELVEGWQPPAETGDNRGCRYFAESGHATCYAFLEFFDSRGGRELFGLPISEFIIQNDRIVQYFQNFRLDWYPEAAEGNQIRVGALGREHFRLEGYDPGYLQPGTQGDEADYRITELRLTASVQSPSIPPEGKQEVYLVVRDQNMLPVAEAAVLLIVHENARDRYFVMPMTNNLGISRTSFQIQDTAHGGTVNLELWVMYAGMESVARDSFTIW